MNDHDQATKKENKVGMRCSDTASLVFDNVRVPASHLLGNEGEGFIQALQILDGGRISIAALSVGLAQGAWNQHRRSRHRPHLWARGERGFAIALRASWSVDA